MLFLLLLLVPNIFAQAPDHALVLAHNLALADGLRHSSVWPASMGNSTAGASNGTPTMSQPISGAYVAFPTASPSVDDRVTDLHPPQVFWAWGEKHAESLVRPLPTRGRCDPGYESLMALLPAGLTGNLTWTLGNSSVKQPLVGDGVDPLKMPSFDPMVWKGLRTKEGANGSALLPNLTLGFAGVVWVHYLYYNQHYEERSGGLAARSGGLIKDDYYCEFVQIQEVRNYTRAVAGQANWSVEHGEPLWVLMAPAGGEQLSWQPQAQVVAMSNRQAERAVMQTSVGEWSTPEADYANQSDEWGLMTIERNQTGIENISAGNGSDENRAGSLASNATFAYLQPLVLDEQGRSFAWQFGYRLEGGLPLGRSNLTAHLFDEFGDEWKHDWPLDTRAGSGIAQMADGAKAVLTDASAGAPAIEGVEGGPGAVIGNAELGRSGAMPGRLLQINGSDTVRPSQAWTSTPAQMPNLVALLPLAVILLLGYSWMEWIK